MIPFPITHNEPTLPRIRSLGGGFCFISRPYDSPLFNCYSLTEKLHFQLGTLIS
uniref:Uncharacterized protein n=1 Tax=Bacillus amyloliquefaciens TaxID=1390 RepID=D0EV53_BACAM|nr:hypothetical protein CC44 [Bacillus amyloliquefaciens]